MPSPSPSSYEHEPSLLEKIQIGIIKNYQFYLGRLFQRMFHWTFIFLRFMGQMFRDAIGK